MLKIVILLLLIVLFLLIAIVNLFEMKLDYTSEGDLLLWYTEKDDKVGTKIRKFYKIF